MAQDFYDKVAKKFGDYSNPARYFQEFTSGAPEEIFKEKLLELSGKDKVVLDAGCGDGRFTLIIAPHFKEVVGNDTSKLMLVAARKLQEEKRNENVDFIEKNTEDLDLLPNSFDVIFARRAVIDYSLFYKMLKPGGYFLTIEIGEKDTKSLKEVFGKGQNYGDWDFSAMENEKYDAEKAGFKIIYCEEFHYNEYYFSYQDLDIFLQGVPIFDDFDSEKDKKSLEEYVKKHQTEKGIDLSRHRFVIVAQKPI